jgi:predicted dehydrogenase
MDYTKSKFLFQLKKTVRYVRLFGLQRTFIKVLGQYHMNSEDGFDGVRWINDRCSSPDARGRAIGILGCGNFAYSHIAYYLFKIRKDFLRCGYDKDPSRSKSLCLKYRGAFACSNWRDVIEDEAVKMVFIASNHASHAEYAVACMKAGKDVHIEKPHVVSEEQLSLLRKAMLEYPESKVFLGFNRPRSPLFMSLKEELSRQSGPLMINWFIAGHAIAEGHWYFDEREGGRVLGNLCHWTDLTLHLVSLERAFPCRIASATPKAAKSDFAVTISFADRSCAVISFSAKGHTFEGVRETLHVHRGDLLASLYDFQVLETEVGEKKRRHRLPHRDHGHAANIRNSFDSALQSRTGETLAYVNATAKFFLAIRRAIETSEEVVLTQSEAMEEAVS